MPTKKIYIIDEECHGAIGCAKSPQAAARWLINTQWITWFTEYAWYSEEEKCWHYTSVNEVAKECGYGENWEQFIIDNASPRWLEEHFLVYLRLVDFATDD